MKHALLLILTGTLFLQQPAFAEQVERLEDLPAQPEFVPSGSVDVWTFNCPAGGSAEIKVDTVSMAANGMSPLNPAVLVYRGNTPLGVGDEEMNCSATPDCPNLCVDLTVACAAEGEHNILVFNKSGDNACGKATGTYKLLLEVFEGPNETGNSLSAAQTALGGKPVTNIFADGARFQSGPAEDDVYWDGAFPLTATDSVTSSASEQNSRGQTTNYYEN